MRRHFCGYHVSRASTDFTGVSSQMEDFNLRRALRIIFTNLGKLSEKKTVESSDLWRLRSVENTEVM